MGATVPAEDLDSEQLDILSGLLRSGDSTEEGPVPGGPDRFSYHLQVRVGHRTHQFDWPEGAVPPQVQPLLAELNRRATPQ